MKRKMAQGLSALLLLVSILVIGAIVGCCVFRTAAPIWDHIKECVLTKF